MISIPQNIISEYDIRAPVEHLSHELLNSIGLLLGDYMRHNNLQRRIAIGLDSRPSSASLQKALCEGLLSAGIDVVCVDKSSTPMMYFCAAQLEYNFAIMITGSHNNIGYNGLKIFQKDRILTKVDLQEILSPRKISLNFPRGRLIKSSTESRQYFARLLEFINFDFSRQKNRAIWHRHLTPFATSNNLFPWKKNSKNILTSACSSAKANLFDAPHCSSEIKKEIMRRKAIVGFSFDSDGDRLYVFDELGKRLSPSEILELLFAAFKIKAGSIILVDTKATRRTLSFIRDMKCHAAFSDPGHNIMKINMQKTGSVLGVEESHHFYFKDFCSGLDDALFSAINILKLLDGSQLSIRKILKGENKWHSFSSQKLFLPPLDYILAVEEVNFKASGLGLACIKSDGIRVDADDFWLLFRQSRTEGFVSCVGEFRDEVAFKKAEALFPQIISSSKLDLTRTHALA